MRLSIRQYAVALLELEKEGDAKEVSKRFSAWLMRRGETGKMRKIVAEAERLLREKSGVEQVSIVTAHEIDAKAKEALASQAEKMFAGKKIAAQFVVDETLVGGVKIKSDEMLYDASIATFLQKMKMSLKI